MSGGAVPSPLDSREERLDDAIRDILDLASGWCSDKLTDAEKLAHIRRIGEEAIKRG